MTTPAARIDALDWTRMAADLDDLGCALSEPGSKAPMRHGVSVVRSGQRHTLALVLHDAQ